jgi:hypothetical protein
MNTSMSSGRVPVVRTVVRFFGRTIRAVSILVRDGRIPKPLRAAAALALLPIPGPFDEAVLLLVALPLFIFYRRSLTDAWTQALPSAERPQLPSGEDEHESL